MGVRENQSDKAPRGFLVLSLILNLLCVLNMVCVQVLVTWEQGLSRLCVQHVIWTPRTLFLDSLDTQKFMSEFADDDFS